MSDESLPTKTCANCQQPITHGRESLVCRGCGWTVHAGCLKGARLCPICTKPLVTPAAAAGFTDSRAQAKRRVEYRLAALLVAGALFVVLLASLLQSISEAWSRGWLDIPFGTWINAACGIFVILTATAFLHLRRPVIAVTALIVFTLLSVGFIPGANVCLSNLLGEGPRIFIRLSLIVSLAPLGIATAAWWEFGKWKQIPGDSGAVKLSRNESVLAPLMESLAATLPVAVSLWTLLIPQRRK